MFDAVFGVTAFVPPHEQVRVTRGSTGFHVCFDLPYPQLGFYTCLNHSSFNCFPAPYTALGSLWEREPLFDGSDWEGPVQ